MGKRGSRKVKKAPPGYYDALCEDIAAKGRTPRDYADNTTKGTKPLLRKWHGFCNTLDRDPQSFLQEAKATHLKVFLKWTLDTYPGIEASSSLHNYWRMLRMQMKIKASHLLSDTDSSDVINYLNWLVKRHGLRRLSKEREVTNVDDIYHILLHHWVRDDSIFPDEQQRNQVATGILMAPYFRCRPVSMFDTRLQFQDEEEEESPSVEDTPSDLSSEDDGGLRSADSNEDDDDFSMYLDSESDNDTDDGADAGDDETRTLLWRHIEFYVARNEANGQPNVLFAKVHILHTKGEDHNPRVKKFVIIRADTPLLCLVDHLLSMALHDNIFVAQSLSNVTNIFEAKIPEDKVCLQLKIQRKALDQPVFQQ